MVFTLHNRKSLSNNSDYCYELKTHDYSTTPASSIAIGVQTFYVGYEYKRAVFTIYIHSIHVLNCDL